MTAVPDFFVSKLRLNLENPRCKMDSDSEKQAVYLNVEEDPKGFVEILESVHRIGFAPEEGNIVVVKEDNVLVVYDGNSRVAALKLLLGQIKPDKALKELLGRKAANLITTASQDKKWRKNHNKVPCVVVSLERAYNVMEKFHTESGKARMRKWNTAQKYRFKSISKDQNRTAAYMEVFNKFISSDFLKEKESAGELKHVRRNKNPDTLAIFERKFPVAVYKEAAMPKYLDATGITIKELDSIYPLQMSEPDRIAFEKFMLEIGCGIINTAKARKLTDEKLFEGYGVNPISIDLKDSSADISSPEDDPDNDTDNGENEGNGGTSGPKKLSRPAYYNQIAELRNLARANGLKKMDQCLVELKTIMGNKNKKQQFPMAAAILIRTCLEVSARHFADKNSINYMGKTLEDILNKIYDSDKVKDPSIYNVLANIKQKSGPQSVVKSLNIIVHHLSYIPVWGEIETHLNNIYPLCYYFFGGSSNDKSC